MKNVQLEEKAEEDADEKCELILPCFKVTADGRINGLTGLNLDDTFVQDTHFKAEIELASGKYQEEGLNFGSGSKHTHAVTSPFLFVLYDMEFEESGDGMPLIVAQVDKFKKY